MPTHYGMDMPRGERGEKMMRMKPVGGAKKKAPAKAPAKPAAKPMSMKDMEAKLIEDVKAKVPAPVKNMLMRGFKQYKKSCMKPVENQNMLEKRVCSKINTLANQHPSIKKLIEFTLKQLQKKSK
tara:strand:+ start:148 stop:522 length:375 start_codon:yes stop_codon:yes gene_type:complete